MSISARDVIGSVARQHGWSVIDPAFGARDGLELVAYERYGTQILIGWTEHETARAVIKDFATPREEIERGPLALMVARGWLEEEESQ